MQEKNIRIEKDKYAKIQFLDPKGCKECRSVGRKLI